MNCSPASDGNVEAAYDAVFFFREATVLDVWPEIVQPPEATALAASLEAL